MPPKNISHFGWVFVKIHRKPTEKIDCNCTMSRNHSSKIIAKGTCSSQRANHERHREHHQPHLPVESGGFGGPKNHISVVIFIDTIVSQYTNVFVSNLLVGGFNPIEKY